MDIRSPALQCSDEHLVDQPNNRNFRSHIAQMGDVLVVNGAFDFSGGRSLGRLTWVAIAKERFNSSGDIFFLCQHRPDSKARCQFQRMKPGDIEWVGSGHEKIATLDLYRYDPSEPKKISDTPRKLDRKGRRRQLL